MVLKILNCMLEMSFSYVLYGIHICVSSTFKFRAVGNVQYVIGEGCLVAVSIDS